MKPKPEPGSLAARPATRRSDRWDRRAFVVTGALLSGLTLPVSGFADHLARRPSGGTAAGWAIVHVSLGTLFVGFCAWHVVLNRRALARHLRGGLPVRLRPTREFLAALALVGAIFAGTVVHAPAGA